MSREDYYHSDGDAYGAGYRDALEQMKFDYTDQAPLYPGWYFLRDKANKKDVQVLYVFYKSRILHIGHSQFSKNSITPTLRQFIRRAAYEIEWAGPIEEPQSNEE